MNARDAVLRCYAAIAEKNSAINAVCELNPDALFAARAIDQKPEDRRGMLFGEAILLKDNINTRDQTHTSAGSLALRAHFAAADATVAARLRDADAVILGKANMTEFANFITQDMPGGYSSAGGQVVNPHNPDSSVSGSSSGSAAAVAAGFCTCALGTETSGSVISPAQNCGICGIKPTVGLVSRAGVIPISPTMDTVGPMAKTVRGAARLLGAIAGYDAADAATSIMKDAPHIDYERMLGKDCLSGTRIGVNTGIKPSNDYAPHAERLLCLLKDAGATLVEMPPIPNTPAGMRIMTGEFRAAMDFYLATAGKNASVRTLEQIAAYNSMHAETCLRYGQTIFDKVLRVSGDARVDETYLNALIERAALQDRLNSIFAELRLDAIVEKAGYNNIAPVSGFPAGTTPIGRYYENTPVGCYLMCEPFREDKLLGLLNAIERRAGYVSEETNIPSVSCQDI